MVESTVLATRTGSSYGHGSSSKNRESASVSNFKNKAWPICSHCGSNGHIIKGEVKCIKLLQLLWFLSPNQTLASKTPKLALP